MPVVVTATVAGLSLEFSLTQLHVLGAKPVTSLVKSIDVRRGLWVGNAGVAIDKKSPQFVGALKSLSIKPEGKNPLSKITVVKIDFFNLLKPVALFAL